MAISRFDRQTATEAGELEDRHKKEQQGGEQAPETPFWEKVVGALGLLIVLCVLGFLLYEAFQPQTTAEIVTKVTAITPQTGGYLVEFEASNHGRKTAAAVAVEGALYETGAGEPVETAEISFDYIPDQSDRQGSFVFTHDPREYELRLQVKGFMDP
jgi:uncharacterized protein (TIGR02588 family)